MLYVLMVTAVVAGFGITAFCAALFHVRSGVALLAILFASAFGAPALVVLLTAPGPAIPWQGIGVSLALATSIAATLGIVRLALRQLDQRRRRLRVPYDGA